MVQAAFAAQAMQFETDEPGSLSLNGYRDRYPEQAESSSSGGASGSLGDQQDAARPAKKQRTSRNAGDEQVALGRSTVSEGYPFDTIPGQAQQHRPSVSKTHRKGSRVDPESRKQNHVSAEQNRRAAIKSGYEALYRVIPALRDAFLTKGKGRGGSGPGGGGALLGKHVNERLEEATAASDKAGGTPVRKPSSSPKSHAKYYPQGQQYDEDGKPIRPGVRPVFPLIRQPGSEIIDGRQGPRSESVVLQKSTFAFCDSAFCMGLD